MLAQGCRIRTHAPCGGFGVCCNAQGLATAHQCILASVRDVAGSSVVPAAQSATRIQQVRARCAAGQLCKTPLLPIFGYSLRAMGNPASGSGDASRAARAFRCVRFCGNLCAHEDMFICSCFVQSLRARIDAQSGIAKLPLHGLPGRRTIAWVPVASSASLLLSAGWSLML